ncbi:MAG TPA: glycosyltransferase family 4 protein, partial [Acinetobacter lwoffii]|nr:glycosyltransferase family 4 protein [Acinetobacter lwoffii]
VIYPQAKNLSIGFNNQPWLRFLAILKQSTEFLKILSNLYTFIKSNEPNFFIVNNEKSLFFLKLLKPFFKFKIILYFRSEGLPSQLTPRFVKSLINDTDHIVAHSQKAIQNLRNKNIPPRKLTFIPNCIELDRFLPPELSRDLPNKKNFRVILAAARPVKEKGHHIAIEAIYELKKRNINIDLLIPGIVPTGVDNSYYDHLKDLIIKYNLKENIYFIGWRENLIADIVQCDAVVLPSHTEGFPRSVIEAMLHRVPVIATPVGGIPEAIQHGKTGMLFEVDSTKQLVDNLESIISNNSLRENIINNAYVYSHDYFNPKNNTQGIISVLEEV